MLIADSSLGLTITIASIVAIISVCLLGIGRLLTGKNKLGGKKCGYNPQTGKHISEDGCSFCGKKTPCEKDKEEKK